MEIMQPFTVHPAAELDDWSITASVGFVSPVSNPDTYLMVHNARGWDIPGGHVEMGETPAAAFAREVDEETACAVTPGTRLIAILEDTSVTASGIAVYRGLCRAGWFTPRNEIQDVALVSRDELLERYFGDRRLMQELLRLI